MLLQRKNNTQVLKAILRSLAPRRPWYQVVPNYSWRQDVLRVKKVASICPASSRSCQDVMYANFSITPRKKLLKFFPNILVFNNSG